MTKPCTVVEKAFDKVRAGLEFAAGPDRTQTDVKIWTLELGIVLDALAMLESDIDDLLHAKTQEPETDEEIDAVLVGAGFNPSDVAIRMRDFAASVLTTRSAQASRFDNLTK